VKIRKWNTLHSDAVYRTPIFDLHRRRSGHPGRGERDFFILDAPNWVNVIPLTRDRKIVMVRQFRHGISSFTLEIPGGMVDPEDASPMAAARREMIEETGYDAAELVKLGRVHPNPAIQPNFCYSFLARNVRQVGKPILHGAEETEVVLVPAAKIKELIASGKITHALVIAAFSFYHLYNPPRPRLRRS
jgi:8-oxo-dGTP pyrophosphatase MutT (NUDIX family)